MLIYRELEATRSIRNNSPLARFFKTQWRWELLLLIATNQDRGDIGIWSYIDMLSTRTESLTTVYNFIKDRVDDGSLLLTEGRKKSMKLLSLAPHIEIALNEFLTKRYLRDASAPPAASQGPSDDVQEVRPPVRTVTIPTATAASNNIVLEID